MKLKKKHFKIASNKLLRDMDYMRINAERERMQKLMHIIRDSSTSKYYKILRAITDLNQKPEKQEEKKKAAMDEILVDFEDRKPQEEEDPQEKIKTMIKEAQINCLIAYVTGKYALTLTIILDYIKQVIENGCKFGKEHLFLLLQKL